MIQAQKKGKAHRKEWETCRNYYLKLLHQTRRVVVSAVAVDSKNIARVVGKKKRHIYLGHKAWQLFFTEKCVPEMKKGRAVSTDGCRCLSEVVLLHCRVEILPT